MASYPNPAEFLSHRPPMLLLSEVASIEEESVQCLTKLGAQGPLAPFANEKGLVGNEFMIELMAQTIGVWAGKWHQTPENTDPNNPDAFAEIGLLLSVRQAKFFY